MSFKIDILKNFAKFKENNSESYLNKVADLLPEILLNKRPWSRCISLNFFKKFKDTLLYRTPLHGFLGA